MTLLRFPVGGLMKKNMITELVNSNKLTDPLTRKPFNKELIYPNHSIQNAVKWYSKIRPDEVFINDKRDVEIQIAYNRLEIEKKRLKK